jgi:membrane complex biogenesis BtpA family protein
MIRVNVHAGVGATDQGRSGGRAAETVRLRAALRLKTAIAADVPVKLGHTLHNLDIGTDAATLVARAHADAIIVSGAGTGRPTELNDLEVVRAAIGNTPLLVGSGATAETVAGLLAIADAVIVGPALKKGAKTTNAVDPARVERFVRNARRRSR